MRPMQKTIFIDLFTGLSFVKRKRIRKAIIPITPPLEPVRNIRTIEMIIVAKAIILI